MESHLASTDVLCDVHLERMIRKSYLSAGSPDHDETTFDVCESLGCRRHFASSLGYVDMLNGRLEQTDRVYRLCENSPVHGKMAKAILQLQGGEPVWECRHCLAIGSVVKGNVIQIA